MGCLKIWSKINCCLTWKTFIVFPWLDWLVSFEQRIILQIKIKIVVLTIHEIDLLQDYFNEGLRTQSIAPNYNLHYFWPVVLSVYQIDLSKECIGIHNNNKSGK